MHEKDPRLIKQGLAEIKRRRALAWLLVLGFLPFAGLVSLLAVSTTIELWLAFAWLGLAAIAMTRATLFPCPRCSRHYHQFGLVAIPWASRCGSCGLQLHGEHA